MWSDHVGGGSPCDRDGVERVIAQRDEGERLAAAGEVAAQAERAPEALSSTR